MIKFNEKVRIFYYNLSVEEINYKKLVQEYNNIVYIISKNEYIEELRQARLTKFPSTPTLTSPQGNTVINR